MSGTSSHNEPEPPVKEKPVPSPIIIAKRKGCGFLIAAITATVIGILVGFVGTMRGVPTVQEAINSSQEADVNFTTPDSGIFTATHDKDATVWLSSPRPDNASPTKPFGYTFKAVSEDGSEVGTSKTLATKNINNQVQLASFPAIKGTRYTVTASGLPDGSHFVVSHASLSELMGITVKAASGFFAALAIGLITFILGIIGLILWLTSKPEASPAPSAL